MKRYNLLLESLSFSILAAVLHFSAIYFYLYWQLPWFDIIVHFSAGISVGFFMLWISSALFQKTRALFLGMILGTLFVALLWEFFEYHFGIAVLRGVDYRFDTVKDLLVGILGGITSFIYFYVKMKSTVIIKKVQNKI